MLSAHLYLLYLDPERGSKRDPEHKEKKRDPERER